VQYSRTLAFYRKFSEILTSIATSKGRARLSSFTQDQSHNSMGSMNMTATLAGALLGPPTGGGPGGLLVAGAAVSLAAGALAGGLIRRWSHSSHDDGAAAPTTDDDDSCWMDRTQAFEVHVTIKNVVDHEPFVEACQVFVGRSESAALEGDARAAAVAEILTSSKVVSCKAIIIDDLVEQQQPDTSSATSSTTAQLERQVMCSMFVSGTAAQAITWGDQFSEFLESHGFDPIRNKVEARFKNVRYITPRRVSWA
jgi:hypothetical protein